MVARAPSKGAALDQATEYDLRSGSDRWPGGSATDQMRLAAADAIAEVPSLRWTTNAAELPPAASGARYGGFVAAADKFDHPRFMVTPRVQLARANSFPCSVQCANACCTQCTRMRICLHVCMHERRINTPCVTMPEVQGHAVPTRLPFVVRHRDIAIATLRRLGRRRWLPSTRSSVCCSRPRTRPPRARAAESNHVTDGYKRATWTVGPGHRVFRIAGSVTLRARYIHSFIHLL